MSRELFVRNRQRVRRVNTPLLRRITRALLDGLAGAEQYELCLHLVGAPEMSRVNEQFLRHTGSTDVITFNHTDISLRAKRHAPRILHGEIFVCLDDAVAQARLFHTTWQSELVRYVVHGVLHLLGHDDLKPAARRNMKREENRLVRQLDRRFQFPQLLARLRSTS